MLINEVAKITSTTKRAIKFYEENNLLKPKKLANGYRDYNEEDIYILQKISFYRKLGISIQDIKKLLKEENKDLLYKIYNDKQKEINFKQAELEAFELYLKTGNINVVEETIDYDNVATAIGSLLPGVWGEYLTSHFKPFLDIKITTNDQKNALNKILEYCDNINIKIPLILKFQTKLINNIDKNTKTAQEMINQYKNISDEEYEKLKQDTLKGAKMKMGIFKYHPAFIAQRKLQIELQNKGYNDILIPNLKKLSPKYAEYKNALDELNKRICDDLGIYYDSKFHLKQK